MVNKDFILWGHSLPQYQKMFDLNDSDLNKKILDCASGYAPFNQEMYQQGKTAISADPAYDLSQQQLQQHIEIGLQNLIKYLQQHPDRLVESSKTAIHEIIAQNKKMVQTFLSDFPLGKKQGRYIATALPELLFNDQQFDLAVCAYFLFSSTQFSQEFHIAAIQEMCRVANEARIYPILNQEGEMFSQLPNILLQLQQKNYGVEIKQVSYELLKGSNAMLRVWAQGCEVDQ